MGTKKMKENTGLQYGDKEIKINKADNMAFISTMVTLVLSVACFVYPSLAATLLDYLKAAFMAIIGFYFGSKINKE